MSIPRFLTPDEVCALLNINRRQLLRIVDRGELHPFDFRIREFRYSQDDIFALIARRNPGLVGRDDDFFEEA